MYSNASIDRPNWIAWVTACMKGAWSYAVFCLPDPIESIGAHWHQPLIESSWWETIECTHRIASARHSSAMVPRQVLFDYDCPLVAVPVPRPRSFAQLPVHFTSLGGSAFLNCILGLINLVDKFVGYPFAGCIWGQHAHDSTMATGASESMYSVALTHWPLQSQQTRPGTSRQRPMAPWWMGTCEWTLANGSRPLTLTHKLWSRMRPWPGSRSTLSTRAS